MIVAMKCRYKSIIGHFLKDSFRWLCHDSPDESLHLFVVFQENIVKYVNWALHKCFCIDMINNGVKDDSKYQDKTHTWKGTVTMKSLKRLLTLFLVVLLAVSLVGCGKKEEEPAEDLTPETEDWGLDEENDDSEDSWDLDWGDTDSDEDDSESSDTWDFDWDDTSSEDEDEEDDDWGFSLE